MTNIDKALLFLTGILAGATAVSGQWVSTFLCIAVIILIFRKY